MGTMGQGGGNKPSGGSGQSGGQGGGKPGGNPFSSGTQGYQPGGSFWDFQARPIAGLNQFMTGAGGIAQGLGGQGAANFQAANRAFQQLGRGPNAQTQQGLNLLSQYSGGNLPGDFAGARGMANRLVDLGNQKVTGGNIESSPSYQAARRAFAQSQLPLIQNQAARAGLGRSSAMTNAIAHGNAQAMLPIIENELAREERGIGRQISTTGQAGSQLFGIGQQALGANQAAAQGYLGAGQLAQQGLGQAAQGQMGLGGQQYQQALQQAGLMSNLGQQYRGVEQEQLNAPYQEQQRQWAEALNAMYGPLGFLGNMGGARTTTDGKK
jgi:hypothetical protein